MAERYVALSDKYLRDGNDLLARNDRVQAGEKLWGSVAVMVKALAEQKGWPHRNHGELVRTVKRLSEELGEVELATMFKTCESLHANFYEDFMDQPQMERNATEAKRLIARLQALQKRGK